VITGVNHLTLAVSDLERSFRFYTQIVGLRPRAKWLRGAYLVAGDDWICLSLDRNVLAQPRMDYTHFAFSVSPQAFADRTEAILASGAVIWKDNGSEGDSLYFLDPDGHKLELHVGNLDSRLAALRMQPYDGLQMFDEIKP
jgi:catechol 2,3-dioxygenase-like lactoylglutathione lyase family enzyme